MLYPVVVLTYPLLLIGIGVWRMRTVHSHSDFMVAGRAVPAWMLAGSLICTWVGSGTLFGGAGLAYRTGLPALWFSLGAWFGLIAIHRMAPRVRGLARFTVPDLLEARYNAAARVLGTAAVLLAYVTVAAYQFRGGGWILAIVTDGAISPDAGMVITAVVIVTFTAVAGMVSIVTVDIVNGVVIALGVVLGLVYVYATNGGTALLDGLPTGYLTATGGHNVFWVLGVAMPTFLFLFGESGMYQKFFSAKDARAAQKAVVGMVVGIMTIEVSIALLSMAGRALYPELGTETSMLGRDASETVILYIARHALPVSGGAVLLAAAVAIVVSSGSTMLLVASSNVSRDLYERFIRPDATDALKLKVQRAWVVAFGLIGLVLLTRFESILSMALYAYSVIGASLTPVLVAAFTWRRVTPQGAVACLAGGLGTIATIAALDALGIAFEVTLGGAVFDLASSDYVVIPAVLVSVGMLVAVSLLTSPSPREVWEPFVTPD